MDKLTRKYLLSVLLTALLTGNGCFSIPFLGHGGPPANFEPQQRDFDSTSVFVGYDGDDRPIVEIRLISEEVTAENGLLIKTKLFPTENFEVVNIFRGLRSINYYPIERRFHRLELKYGRREIKMKVSENMQIKGDKPVDADFEHTGIYQLLPDTIDALKLKFQDVDRWGKMPEDTLEAWYAAKDQYYQLAQRRQQRSTLVESYRRLQKDDYTKTFTQYDSLYVTINNAYVYLEKDVNSDILYTLSAGDQVDYGVSDGIWIEIPTPDSMKPELMDFFEKRQQDAIKQRETQMRLARSSRGGRLPDTNIDTTLRFTGYLLDVMAQKKQEQAIAWEKDNMLPPVDVPLFAQVLSNREAARLARRDSIAKAIQDSIQAIADSIAAVAAADSAAADSAAARAAADSTGAAAPVGAAATDATPATAADSSAAKTQEAATPGAGATQANAPADSSAGSGSRSHRLVGPNGQVWVGEGPPPWAGTRNDSGDSPGNGPQPPQPPQPDSTAAPDSSSAPAPDSSSGANQPPPGSSPSP